jgi:O-antigen ligase
VWSATLPARIGWACTLGLVLLFELHAGQASVWLLAVPLLACVFFLQLADPAKALALLPAPLVLGPIARVSLPGGLLLHVGDLAVGVMVLGYLLHRGHRARAALGQYELPILLTIGLVLVGWLFGLDMRASVPSMVAMAEALAIYILTVAAIQSTEEIDQVILGWIAAVALGAVLVIVAYVTRQPLVVGGDFEAQREAARIASSTSFLYRASFFVTGFGYPLGAVALCSTLWLVAGKGSARARFLLGIGLLIEVITLGFMGGATTAAGVAAGLVMMAFWTLWLPRGPLRVFILVAALAFVGLVIAAVLSQVMSPAQLKLLVGRTHQADSLFERFKVWRNVGDFLLTSPHAILLGLGPDITVRRGDLPLIRELFNGRGVQQNAVDSGYLYLLLNYGIFVTTLVVGMAVATLLRLTRAIMKTPDATRIAVWLSIFVWLIMALTQQGGLSKPMFITAQFVALGSLLYTHRNDVSRLHET